MKLQYLALSAIVALTGCISTGTRVNKAGEVVTKSKAFLGLVPIPGTGGDLVTDPTPRAQAMAQLAPLIWASIPLIIGGIIFWKVTAGATGIGRTLVFAGAAFIATAVIVPTIIVYLKWGVLIALIGMVVYGLYYLWSKKSRS